MLVAHPSFVAHARPSFSKPLVDIFLCDSFPDNVTPPLVVVSSAAVAVCTASDERFKLARRMSLGMMVTLLGVNHAQISVQFPNEQLRGLLVATDVAQRHRCGFLSCHN